MRELLFYFDVVCPYAYLASTQVERVARDGGARLVWKPMLLGGVLKALGGGAGASLSPEKAAMNLLDQRRWARHWGVPLRMPPGHPRRTVEAMRLCVAAGERVAPVAHDLFRAYWVDGRDVSDPGVLAAIAGAHGLSPEAAASDAAKEGLRAITDEALGAGAFGAPTFIVRLDGASHLFWGQDRLHFVEKALGGWRVPA